MQTYDCKRMYTYVCIRMYIYIKEFKTSNKRIHKKINTTNFMRYQQHAEYFKIHLRLTLYNRLEL